MRLVAFVVLVGWSSCVAAAEFASHPPTRPLPQASNRPMNDGPAKFVDAAKGDDAGDGGEAKPWKTLAHAVGQLVPGDTLYLRGGTYFEHVAATLVGTPDKPITIRAYPGELVTLDGGIAEFQLAPATAWEPCPGGAPGEFRSTKTYADLETTQGELQVSLMGRFVDSLLPLHGYWHYPDLQSDNPYWTLGGGEKVKPEAHVYCGPGLWYDRETDRIHIRLAHTTLPGLGDDNYRGEQDPRRLALVVAAYPHGSVLSLERCRSVRLQDLVIRGARTEPLKIEGGGNLELDGLTLYGGGACLRAASITGLRMVNTACRGIAAPWTFRGSLKYRSIEARLIRTGGWDSTGFEGSDYEFASSEFTDSVDGVFVGGIQRVRFHHNLVENVSDDGVFVTANTGYDGRTNGGDMHFYQNRFSRCLTMFAFGVGHGRQKSIDGGKQLGGGLWIYRNVFDFRRPVMYRWPSGPDDVQEIDSLGRFGGDHGSPAWEPMWIYHNTMLTGEPTRAEYAGAGIGNAMGHGTQRRVFNNIFCQKFGPVKDVLPPTNTDFAADGNLFWSATDGATQGEWCRKFRNSPEYAASKQRYAPGWTTNDKFADPRFTAYDVDWRKPTDLRLRDDSPAVDAGVDLPSEWRDALRDQDAGRPDLGALPKGVSSWRIGCYGRLDVCDNPTADATALAAAWDLPTIPPDEIRELIGKPVAVVTGYPAFEAPLAAFALRRRGVPVVEFERQWLDPREYANFGTVVVDGSFTRGKITPDRYSADDLPHVKRFLEEGGTLWLFRERQDLFADPEAKRLLYDLTGGATSDRSTEYAMKLPDHPWVRHLSANAAPDWLTKNVKGLSITKGDVVLGTKLTNAALGRVPVGKGQIIYVGWNVAASLPNGRAKITVADEDRFAEQMQVLTNIVESLYPSKN